MEEKPPVKRCPRCDTVASGNYCSNCGAPLDGAEGSLGGEIKSKFVDPITGMLAFFKAAWLLTSAPWDFCRAWLNGPQGMAHMDFPLSRVWRALSNGAQNVLPPFRALAVGIGLVATASGIEAVAWKIAGLQELREEAARRQEMGIQQTARYYFGHEMRILRISQMTGFAPLDSALEEAWRMVDYLAFAALVAALMPRLPLVHKRAVLHYFAFAVGVSLAIQTAAVLVASVVFIPLASGSLRAALAVQDFLELVFGLLPTIWFGALLPIVVFPSVIPISRPRVIGAVLGGSPAWE